MGTLENESAWSTTAATNANADSGIVWTENQDPASVNNSARGMMTARAKARADQGGALVAAGTGDALTVTTNQVLSAAHLAAGQRLLVQATAVNTIAAVTFAPDGLTAAPIKRSNGSALAAGDIRSGASLDLVYNAGSSEWRAVNIAPATGADLASFSANNGGVGQFIPASTFTTVNASTEAWDIGSYYTLTAGVTGRWTPPAGKCLINARATMTTFSTNAITFIVGLYKNGALSQESRITTGAVSSYGVGGTWIANANGTDYFEMKVFHSDSIGQTLLGGGTQTYFAGSML